MSRRLKMAIIIVVGALAILVVLYLIVWPIFSTQSPAVTNTNQPVNANVNANAPIGGAEGTPVQPPTEVPAVVKQEASAKTIAKMFAERLGSYSNQTGLSNLDDLAPISTAELNKYLQGEYRRELEKSMPSANTYYGVTSTAAGVNITVTDETTAEGTVSLQKVETGTVQKTGIVTLELKLTKIAGVWLVSRLDWK